MFINNLNDFEIIRKRFSIWRKKRYDKMVEFRLINKLSKKDDDIKRVKFLRF